MYGRPIPGADIGTDPIVDGVLSATVRSPAVPKSSFEFRSSAT